MYCRKPTAKKERELTTWPKGTGNGSYERGKTGDVGSRFRRRRSGKRIWGEAKAKRTKGGLGTSAVTCQAWGGKGFERGEANARIHVTAGH